jgi:hypothetical protein
MDVGANTTNARVTRLVAVMSVAALIAGACGANDDVIEPTPVQAEAISTLITAELSTDEQRCMLDGLIESEIDPAAVIEGVLSGQDDATLLAVAVDCVEDLTQIPGFVQSFIEGAAQEGAPLTETQALCLIESIDTLDPPAVVAECLGADQGPDDNPLDDRVLLDLLSTACAGGNNQACDELYAVAPQGSDYLEVGRTCAGQLPDSVGLRCYLDLDT